MNVQDALDMSRAELRRLSLADRWLHEWRIEANPRLKRALGRCHYRKKLLELSEAFIDANDWHAVRDVLLHEVAHAMAPGDGHGAQFAKACRMLGVSNRACGRLSDYDGAAPTWATVCTCCGKRTGESFRKRPARSIVRRVSRCCYKPIRQERLETVRG